MYSHSCHVFVFDVVKAAATFLVTLVTSCMRRLIFKFCFERGWLDHNCDKVNHKSEIIKHYKLWEFINRWEILTYIGLVPASGHFKIMYKRLVFDMYINIDKYVFKYYHKWHVVQEISGSTFGVIGRKFEAWIAVLRHPKGWIDIPSRRHCLFMRRLRVKDISSGIWRYTSTDKSGLHAKIQTDQYGLQ